MKTRTRLLRQTTWRHMLSYLFTIYSGAITPASRISQRHKAVIKTTYWTNPSLTESQGWNGEEETSCPPGIIKRHVVPARAHRRVRPRRTITVTTSLQEVLLRQHISNAKISGPARHGGGFKVLTLNRARAMSLHLRILDYSLFAKHWMRP